MGFNNKSFGMFNSPDSVFHGYQHLTSLKQNKMGYRDNDRPSPFNKDGRKIRNSFKKFLKRLGLE